MRLVTAADLCDGLEAVLVAGVADVIEALGLVDVLKPVRNWHQLPDLKALTTANVPAGAITSSGLVAPPVRRGGGTDATWRLVAGVYDRDADHTATSQRTMTWAAVIRATVLAQQSLGGVAESVTWTGEEYRQFPAIGAARTIGGCAVAFDVAVHNVVDLSDVDLPLVRSTHTALTARPQE